MQANNEIFDEVFFRLFRCMKHDALTENVTATLTLQQIHALFFLHHNGKVQMKDVAEYFHIETPTATSLLKKLVALKFVKRQNDTRDRRAVYVLLTTKGEDIVKEALKKRSQKIAKMLSLLSEKDKEKLLNILQTIVTNLEKQYEK